MTGSRYAYNIIDKVASDIIKQNNLSVPINMGKLFSCFDNIDVYSSDSPELKRDQIYGVVNKIGNKKYKIYYLKDQPHVRARFTLAHELGHIKLDHMQGTEVMVDRLHRSTGFGGEDAELDEKEKEANDFAGCLLMPKEHTIAKWKEFGNIPAMADYFMVSEHVAAIRVSKLNLIKY